MFVYIRRHFEQTLQQIGATSNPQPLTRLREAIAENASFGVYDAMLAAERAHLSLRSAQYLASAHGTTLRRLSDEVRGANAKEFLRRQELTIPMVASLVGYSDERAFRRAFERWTGQSPAKFRQTNVENPQ